MEEVFRGIWVIAYRELLRFFVERSRMISSFAMPLLFFVIFGSGFNRIVGSLTPGVDFVKFIYPGIIAMTVLTNSIFSGLSVVWDREFGFLREVLVAPLSRTGIVLGKAAGSASVSVAQGIILLFLAPILDMPLTLSLVGTLIILMIVIAVSLSGLGILVASRMRSQQGFQLIVQVVIFPLIFISGVFFPVNNVPTWLSVLSKMNPLTYGVDSIRQLFLGGSIVDMGGASGGNAAIGVTIFGHTMTMWQDIALVAVFGAVLLSAAIYSFSRQE